MIYYLSTLIHIQTKFSNIQTNLNSIFNIQYFASTSAFSFESYPLLTNVEHLFRRTNS